MLNNKPLTILFLVLSETNDVGEVKNIKTIFRGRECSEGGGAFVSNVKPIFGVD